MTIMIKSLSCKVKCDITYLRSTTNGFQGINEDALYFSLSKLAAMGDWTAIVIWCYLNVSCKESLPLTKFVSSVAIDHQSSKLNGGQIVTLSVLFALVYIFAVPNLSNGCQSVKTVKFTLTKIIIHIIVPWPLSVATCMDLCWKWLRAGERWSSC